MESYGEYRDYNATTTQSDRGEMLYTLLDFLRVKVGYERVHWNLRPAIMAHEVLVRRGCHGAAEIWRRAMAAAHRRRGRSTTGAAGGTAKQIRHAIADHRRSPLGAFRAAAGHRSGAGARRSFGRRSPARSAPNAFALLEQEAGELAEEPCGAGLDLPDWLELLEDEVEKVTDSARGWDVSTANDALRDLPWRALDWDEIQSQLTDWDLPPEGK